MKILLKSNYNTLVERDILVHLKLKNTMLLQSHRAISAHIEN